MSMHRDRDTQGRPPIRHSHGDDPSQGERFAEKRSWLSRAADEIASWAGDPDAARRRQLDQAAGDHTGQGPKTYLDDDQRILTDVSRRMADSAALDASDIIITVDKGFVRLDGRVAIHADKRLAEDLAEAIPGVVRVENNLRVGDAL